MRFPKFMRKNYKVVDKNGLEQETYFRYKNAKTFADEMNSSKWSWLALYQPYTIKPIKE